MARIKKKVGGPNLYKRLPKKKAPRIAPKRKTRNVALREIRRFQRTTNLLLPKLPFSRLVRQIVDDHYTPPGVARFRWQSKAIEALQEAAEAHLVHLFENVVLCTAHRGRVTIERRDMRLALHVKGREFSQGRGGVG